MQNPYDDDDENGGAGPARPSKSALKREFVHIQGLVRRLAALSDSQLAALPLEEDAREAIKALRRMKRQAMERQVRYASGLLARSDHVALVAALDLLERPQRTAVRAFHEVEVWRARLVAGDRELLADIVARYPAMEPAVITGLIEDAQREAGTGHPARAARALFRYLAQRRGAD